METMLQPDTGNSTHNDPTPTLPPTPPPPTPSSLYYRGALINCDRNTQAVPYFKNTALDTQKLNTSYRLQMTMKVSDGSSCKHRFYQTHTRRQSCEVNVTIVSVSPPPSASMQTLSEKNNIKIGVSIQPYLSCSLVELIYHCVYCTPHSSLFMLWQNKRERSREVLRTVFVCHRVPFLIPQAPAMHGGAACGGGSPAQKHAFLVFFFFFPLRSQSGVGGWAPEKARLIP